MQPARTTLMDTWGQAEVAWQSAAGNAWAAAMGSWSAACSAGAASWAAANPGSRYATYVSGWYAAWAAYVPGAVGDVVQSANAEMAAWVARQKAENAAAVSEAKAAGQAGYDADRAELTAWGVALKAQQASENARATAVATANTQLASSYAAENAAWVNAATAASDKAAKGQADADRSWTVAVSNAEKSKADTESKATRDALVAESDAEKAAVNALAGTYDGLMKDAASASSKARTDGADAFKTHVETVDNAALTEGPARINSGVRQLAPSAISCYRIGIPPSEVPAVAKLIDVESIASYFQSLGDPRYPKNRKHLLIDIIIICVAGVVSGCDGPTAIHGWASSHKERLAKYLHLPNGIPSRDCIRRVLLAIQPEAFQRCFAAWMIQISATRTDESTKPGERLIAIDGKTCRGSRDDSRFLGPLHLVRAWASEEGLALGQVATEGKSNEITAIPLLLEQISLEGAIVTIDAMGCQKAIVERGGDAVIAVKNNQPKLFEAIESHFEGHLNRDIEDLQYRHFESCESGHGRTDDRSYFATDVPKDFGPSKDWPRVKAIGYSIRHVAYDDGRESTEVRYFISTQNPSGKRFAEAVRGYWGIESMHRVLDVTFREDDRRTRERAMGNNLSWLRRFAVGLLKRHPAKDSIRGKMLSCGYNPDFLAEVLGIQSN